jgi:hypothetical protein
MMDVEVFNNSVSRLEAAMLEMPQAQCDVRHIFGPGVYIREVHLPAGIFAIGHHQKKPHMNVLVKGSVRILNEHGEWQTLEAPLTYVGKPGRKVGYVFEDVIWHNIYATEKTDVDELEREFLDKSPAFIDSAKRLTHQADYKLMLTETGFTEDQARTMSENTSDQVPFPPGAYKVKIGSSQIHGRGLVATSSIAPDEVIAPARIGEMRTPAGRFTNHSETPNARMVLNRQGDIDLVAMSDIRGCMGGHDGEEITIDYRDSIKLLRGISQ